MNEINAYRDPAIATMLASLGSTADANAANASPKGPGSAIANIQNVLQQLNQIVGTLGALAPSLGAAAQPMTQTGGAQMGQLPQPLQQLANAALAFAKQLTPQSPTPLPAGAPAQGSKASAPTATAAPAATASAPTTSAPADAKSNPATSTENAIKQLGEMSRQAVAAVNTPAQPVGSAGDVQKQAVDQAKPTAQKVGDHLKVGTKTGEAQPPMSTDRAMRVLADNFPEIQSEQGIKLSDLKQLAKGEAVNGMTAPPSALLQQAAKTFADNPKAFGEAETLAQHTVGDKKAKGDGVLGLEDLSYNLNRAKTLGAGEKEAVQTLDTHKDQLFGKKDKIDVSVLKSVADTGKLPDGKDAPADLKAAAERVTSSPWLMTKLDTGDSASQGKWDVRANGEISKKDIEALLKQDGKGSVDQAQGAKGSAAPTASAKSGDLDTNTVSTLAQQAKAAFGDKAKVVLEAVAKAENGEKLDGKIQKAVEGLVTAATEAFGDAKTAAKYLGAAAKQL